MTPQCRQKLIESFHYKLADECKLVKIFLMDDVVFIPESLLRMSSSFLSAILKETLSFTKELTIFLPEVDRRIISCIKNILLKGEGSLNTPNLKDVKAAAQNLGINFGSLSIEPSKAQVVVKDEPVIPKLEKIKNEPTEYFESDFENVTTEKTELELVKVEKSPLSKYEKSPLSLNMSYNESERKVTHNSKTTKSLTPALVSRQIALTDSLKKWLKVNHKLTPSRHLKMSILENYECHICHKTYTKHKSLRWHRNKKHKGRHDKSKSQMSSNSNVER